MILTRMLIAAAVAAEAGEPARAAILGPSPAGSTFTFQGVALLVAIVGGIITILMTQRKVRRESEADSRERTNEILGEVRENRKTEDQRFREIEGRVRAAETKMERFVPGDIIDQKIDHLKGNRQMVEEKHEREIKELTNAVHGIERQVAKLEERHDGTDRTLIEVKQLMKDMAQDMKAGFKEIVDNRRAA